MKIKSAISLLVILTLISCKSDYEKLVDKELARNVRYDSLLFDFKFGDSGENYNQELLKLNQKYGVQQGSDSRSIEYIIKSGEPTRSDIRMLFFPDFDEDQMIAGMNMSFYYQGWSPSNKELQADQLLLNLIDSLELWYPGNKFMKLEYDTEPTEIWVKVDGNRRISMAKSDFREVKVKIKDISKDDSL